MFVESVNGSFMEKEPNCQKDCVFCFVSTLMQISQNVTILNRYISDDYNLNQRTEMSSLPYNTR